MKKESVVVMLFVLVVLGGSGNIVPGCAAMIGAGPGTPCEDVDIIFIMDCSGSMTKDDAGAGVTRMEAAKVAAKDFIDLLPTGTNTRVGVVSYESYGDAAIEQPLTTNFADAKTAIDGLTAEGWTAIGEGLEKSKDELAVNGNTNRRVFLLLTDGIANRRPPAWSPPGGWVSPPGTWNDNESYAFVEAHDAMILDVTNPTKIYTVGMGSPTEVHGHFLEVLAHSSGGEYFYAGTTAVSEMFDEVQADICYGDIKVLILSNLDRMDDLGMDPAPSNLESELQDLADNNPNERGVAVDLGDLCDPSSVDYNAPIGTAYSNWDGHEGDVTLTNALVDAIDDYIEDLKQTTYPLMRYVIIVGSHEVIPMKARPQDYVISATEKNWASNLPQTSGYLYDIYHEGTDGHYMTDTPYSDLSYMDTLTDHELTPELSVSRLVETPQQIVGVIDTYMAANGIIPRNDFVSIASHDYLDSGTLASDYMTATGVSTDDSLVQSSFSSLDVPPLLNTTHDVVYFAGHGDYNVISTYGDSFMAGNSATHGDTDATDSVDGAVIITSGCHNGVNFGNMLYHAPDAGTTYSEFPEEFAENGVVAYIGATGYTVISGSGSSTTTSFTGYNEKLATNVVYYTVNCVDIGRAFRNGANDYYVASTPIQNVDRRVLAIPTLYGIPTYRDPVTPESAQAPMTPAAGTDVMRAEATEGQSEIVTVDVSDYTVESSGIVTIPGVEQVVSFNEPILPHIFVERTFPRGSVVGVEWLEDASEYVVIKNDVPIAGITCGNVTIPGTFDYMGFWPLQPHRSYQSLTFGAGGTEVGFVAYPVQYNMATGETKIWTRMKFSVNYKVRPTGISVVNLYPDKSEYSPDKPPYSPDEPLYSPDDTMKLNMWISSRRHTSLMNLGMVMRDMDTGKEIGRMEIGRIGLEGGTTTRAGYSVDLGSIPPNMLEGRTVSAELIVSDSHNGDILASKSFEFEVAGKSRIFFSTEEDFMTRGPEPADGNNIISDGDLLCSDGTVFARNLELLKAFKTEVDIGLDASDVIDEENPLVAFSTELNDPEGRFTAGDLLATNGAVIPNSALLTGFDLKVQEEDLGLDAVHFVGDESMIIKFLEYVAGDGGNQLKERPEMLPGILKEFGIDIWFSTEGTPEIKDPKFLDGDLLSARDGTIVARNSILLPASVPAGIPDRGVDFGLDAAVSDRTGNEASILFSTEILHEGKFCFTDGDLLLSGNGIVHVNEDLIKLFKPRADFLGLDAISLMLHKEYPIDSNYPNTTICPRSSIEPIDEKTPKIFFSIEEEFVTQGPEPADGNPIISDGDLLCFQTGCIVFARNRELLKAFDFDMEVDLGLDAADVIGEGREPPVAFSTELDDPKGRFTAGDLLATTGAVIPNSALLIKFDLSVKEEDLGLDAVHFTGEKENIASFLKYVADDDACLHDPKALPELLEKYEIDIWFSTEGTPVIDDPIFLDGDLLSARYGIIVAGNSVLLPASVPAGIPDRGVDFGLDAATTDRDGNRKLIRFSTEILYRGRTCFTDGDILLINNGVTHTNSNLISGFEPKAKFLGLDALSIAFEEKPDLVIRDISLTNAIGEVCYVSYLIANIGASGASASTTDLYIDGNLVGKDPTVSLAPGAERWDTFGSGHPVTTGTHRLEVCADGPDAIDELSERNNCRTEWLRCPPYTTTDVVIALRMAVGASPPTQEADMNGDGVVNSLDALMMLQRTSSN